MNVSDGKLIWSKNFKTDFGVRVPIWGFSAHPLIESDLLITMVGGSGQSVVAFDKLTGEVRWKALDANAGYCPPSIIEQAGTRQLIVYHPQAIVSLNPQDATIYWEVPIKPQYEMSIARPMVDSNQMFVSGIGTQSVMLSLDQNEPQVKEVWRGKRTTSLYSANATPLFVDGVVYGSDCQLGSLMAVDQVDGTRLWTTFDATQPKEKRRVSHGTAFLTRIGETNRYFIFSETGDLLIAELTREAYKPLGRFHVLEPSGEAFGRDVVWSHPAYANRTAYIRNDKEIVAVDISK